MSQTLLALDFLRIVEDYIVSLIQSFVTRCSFAFAAKQLTSFKEVQRLDIEHAKCNAVVNGSINMNFFLILAYVSSINILVGSISQIDLLHLLELDIWNKTGNLWFFKDLV